LPGDIYASRIGIAGQFAWTPEVREVAVRADDQLSPGITSDGSGGAYIGWRDNRPDDILSYKIYGQHIGGSNGQSSWTTNGILIHDNENYNPPRLVPNKAIGVFIGAYANVAGKYMPYLQSVPRSGISPSWPAFTPPSVDMNAPIPNSPPAIAVDSQEGIFVAWSDVRNGSPALYVSRSDTEGRRLWERAVSQGTITPTTEPVIIEDGQGGFLVAWISPVSAGSTDDRIRIQRYGDDGVAVWPSPISLTAEPPSGSKRRLQIARASNSIFTVVWQESGTDLDIMARLVNINGVATPAAPIPIVRMAGTQQNHRIIANNRNGVLIAWEDQRLATAENQESDIYAQLLDANGAIRWDPNGRPVATATGLQTRPSLTHDGMGGAIIAWQDRRNGMNDDIFAQKVSWEGELGEFRSITLENPGPNTIWEVGSKQNITWTTTGDIDSVTIELSRDGGATFSETIATEVPSPSSPSSYQWTVSGAVSGDCRLRVRSFNAQFIIGESDTSFQIVAKAGPTMALSDTISTAIYADSSLRIQTVSTDVSGIASVVLGVRQGGNRLFQNIAMTETSDDLYEAPIPASAVSEGGFAYTVTSTDNINERTTSDTFFVTVLFGNQVQTTAVQAGNTQNAYRMLSAPNILNLTLADSILMRSGFAPYDTTRWRMFEYIDSTYVERDSASQSDFRFLPGRAFWLITAENRTIDFGAGRSIDMNSNFTMTLRPGWTQIANPFSFPVAWDTIAVASNGQALGLQAPYGYSGQYALAENLEPYKGYFILNPNPDDIQLTIPPISAPGTLSKPTLANTDGWALQIVASCEDARDSFNYLGVNHFAQREWDMLDHPEPPPVGEYISVYFPRNDWLVRPAAYTTDFVNNISGGYTWTVKVRTNIGGAEAQLNFDELNTLPENIEVVLLDESLAIRQNLRSNSRYAFPTGPKGAVKELKILAGPGDYIQNETAHLELLPSQYELFQNYPNPFNPTTSIRFALPEAASVTIRVFDLLGKEVTALINNQEIGAGFHFVNWDGRDKYGIPVATGPYIFQISTEKFKKSLKMMLIK
jgi:hypothetical protein